MKAHTIHLTFSSTLKIPFLSLTEQQGKRILKGIFKCHKNKMGSPYDLLLYPQQH